MHKRRKQTSNRQIGNKDQGEGKPSSAEMTAALKSVAKKVPGTLVALSLTALVVGLYTYAWGGYEYLGFCIFIGLPLCLALGATISPGTGLVAGLAVGLFFSMTVGRPQGFRWVLAYGAAMGFGIGFIIGFSKVPPYRKGPDFYPYTPEQFRNKLELYSAFLMAAGMFYSILKFDPEYKLIHDKHDTSALQIYILHQLPSIVVGGMSFMITSSLGSFLGKKSRPGFLIFNDLWLYLREMGAPLFSFAFGYVALCFLFACAHASLWRYDPGSFTFAAQTLDGSAVPSFADFLYFSAVTIATLGYGDVTPKSGAARFLACSEVIMGIGWITVVFAAALAYLQPRFVEITKQIAGRRENAKGDEE